MSALIEQNESFNLAANDRRTVEGLFDFVFFETLPSGVLVAINGEPARARRAGSIRSGVPGRDDIRTVEFVNTTGSTAAVAALFGNGAYEISGEVTLIGSIPLPSGAATAANQTTGNATLAQLAATSSRTVRGKVLSNATEAFASKKSISVANRATSTGNVTVTFADATSVVLEPGEGMSWAVPDRLDTFDSVSVTSPDTTTFALISCVA